MQVLRRAGHTLAEVAKLTGIGRESARIEDEAAVETTDNVATRASRQIGRPSALHRYARDCEFVERLPEIRSTTVSLDGDLIVDMESIWRLSSFKRSCTASA
jgi:hypothetical protein